MKNKLLFLLSFSFVSYSYGQSLSWPMGYNDLTNRSFLLEYKNGALSWDTSRNIRISFEASIASITDSFSGKLLIYTNGCEVYNSFGTQLVNGNQINFGGLSSDVCSSYGYLLAHSITIINFPGRPNKFLLLHQKAEDVNSSFYKITEMLYSIIDLANSIDGEVISKNTLIEKGDFIPLAFTKHANGRDYWLILGQRLTNQYSIYLIDSLGINLYYTQDISLSFDIEKCNSNQRLLCSPDGSICARYTRCGILFFDFDRCLGVLKKKYFLPYQFTEIPSGDISFSLNSNYLFVTNWDEIIRISIQQLGIDIYPFILKRLGNTAVVHLMQLLPNGSVLLNAPNSENYLHLIINTEAQFNFDFIPNFISTPFNIMRTMPYHLAKDPGRLIASPCDSLVSSTRQNITKTFTIYPNPVSSHLKVILPFGIVLEDLSLYNNQGILLKSRLTFDKANMIDISNIPQGMYHLGIRTKNGIIYSKFVKI